MPDEMEIYLDGKFEIEPPEKPQDLTIFEEAIRHLSLQESEPTSNDSQDPIRPLPKP